MSDTEKEEEIDLAFFRQQEQGPVLQVLVLIWGLYNTAMVGGDRGINK